MRAHVIGASDFRNQLAQIGFYLPLDNFELSIADLCFHCYRKPRKKSQSSWFKIKMATSVSYLNDGENTPVYLSRREVRKSLGQSLNVNSTI